MSLSPSYWRKCQTCNKEINFGETYQKCTVSSCKKNVYCSVDCWELHVPVMNHKNASAEENRAPSKNDFISKTTPTERPKRRIITSNRNTSESIINSQIIPQDILIVASKLKNYVKLRSDLNTSANVMDKLSELVRDLCDQAIENAKQEGRKTLMDKDFK